MKKVNRDHEVDIYTTKRSLNVTDMIVDLTHDIDPYPMKTMMSQDSLCYLTTSARFPQSRSTIDTAALSDPCLSLFRTKSQEAVSCSLQPNSHSTSSIVFPKYFGHRPPAFRKSAYLAARANRRNPKVTTP